MCTLLVLFSSYTLKSIITPNIKSLICSFFGELAIKLFASLLLRDSGVWFGHKGNERDVNRVDLGACLPPSAHQWTDCVTESFPAHRAHPLPSPHPRDLKNDTLITRVQAIHSVSMGQNLMWSSFIDVQSVPMSTISISMGAPSVSPQSMAPVAASWWRRQKTGCSIQAFIAHRHQSG